MLKPGGYLYPDNVPTDYNKSLVRRSPLQSDGQWLSGPTDEDSTSVDTTTSRRRTHVSTTASIGVVVLAKRQA